MRRYWTQWLDARSSFAILDQMAVSLGNCVTNLVLIRTLDPASFGIYAVLWTLLLWLNTMQSSLIIHPMVVLAAPAPPEGARKLAAAGLRSTVAMMAIFAAAVVIACAILHRLPLAVWMIPALLAWQIQEALRRALMSQRRYRDCLWGDSISYCGQALLMFAAAAAGMLALPGIFSIIAATSLIAAVVQYRQVRPARLPVSEFATAAREMWSIGKWIANQNLTASVITTALPWYLAFARGPVGAAEYQALYYATGIVQPLMLSIGALVAVEVARSAGQWSAVAGLREAARPVIFGLAGISAYGLILMIFPRAALALLFGRNSPYAALTAQLRIFVFAMLFLYCSQMLLEALVGMRKMRAAFLSQVCASAACAVAGAILVPRAGIMGAACALAAAYLVRLLSAGSSLRTLARSQRLRSAPVPVEVALP